MCKRVDLQPNYFYLNTEELICICKEKWHRTSSKFISKHTSICEVPNVLAADFQGIQDTVKAHCLPYREESMQQTFWLSRAKGTCNLN